MVLKFPLCSLWKHWSSTLEMWHEHNRHKFLPLDFWPPEVMKIFPYVFFQVFLPSHLDLLFTWNWLLLDWFYSIYMGSSEKAMAPHSSTLVWKIPWMEEPGRPQSIRLLRVRHDWVTSLSLSCTGEGNGNPLQYLAWRIPGTEKPGGLPSVGSQSLTRLKWLSSLLLVKLVYWHLVVGKESATLIAGCQARRPGS